MQAFKTAVLATSLIALAGCSELNSYLEALRDNTHLCIDGWYGYRQDPCPPVPVKAKAAASDGLAEELFAAQQQNAALRRRVSDVERQLADRDREIASLRSGARESAAEDDISRLQKQSADLERQLAASKRRTAELEAQLAAMGGAAAGSATLQEAQRGLIRALRPQIEKGDITVDLNNERLLIHLASGYLFASGEDQLKLAGADALKQVGAILKDYPEYKVAVDGHTDNRPIRSALKTKFPTNQELSEARAANAAKALMEGGLSNVSRAGYADTRPVASNTTEEGRAKNRRVEVRVTR